MDKLVATYWAGKISAIKLLRAGGKVGEIEFRVQ